MHMSNLLSKSLLVAGVCITALAATAPSSAHDTGIWLPGSGKTCITVCKEKGLETALSGHVGTGKIHYAVCRIRKTGTSTDFRAGFNYEGRPNCFAYSSIIAKIYDCLCLKS
jgi:hypothetical protein